MPKVSQLDAKRRVRRIKYLAEELTDTKDIISLVSSEVMGIVNILHGHMGHYEKKMAERREAASKEKRRPKPTLRQQRTMSSEKVEEIEEIVEESSPSWAKKIYREIARATHPDICASSGLSPDQVEEREEMMMNANVASSTKNWNALIDIAAELGILDKAMGDEEFVAALADREKELDTELQNQKGTFFWHWYQSAGNEKMRVKMINAYMESAGYSSIEEDVVLKILRDIQNE